MTFEWLEITWQDEFTQFHYIFVWSSNDEFYEYRDNSHAGGWSMWRPQAAKMILKETVLINQQQFFH